MLFIYDFLLLYFLLIAKIRILYISTYLCIYLQFNIGNTYLELIFRINLLFIFSFNSSIYFLNNIFFFKETFSHSIKFFKNIQNMYIFIYSLSRDWRKINRYVHIFAFMSKMLVSIRLHMLLYRSMAHISSICVIISWYTKF